MTMTEDTESNEYKSKQNEKKEKRSKARRGHRGACHLPLAVDKPDKALLSPALHGPGLRWTLAGRVVYVWEKRGHGLGVRGKGCIGEDRAGRGDVEEPQGDKIDEGEREGKTMEVEEPGGGQIEGR